MFGQEHNVTFSHGEVCYDKAGRNSPVTITAVGVGFDVNGPQPPRLLGSGAIAIEFSDGTQIVLGTMLVERLRKAVIAAQ